MTQENNNREKGKKSEDIAAKYLVDLGYEIKERNVFLGHYGEIDIIAFDPLESCLVFVEVKGRVGIESGYPEESINNRKRKQLKKLAEYYIYNKDIKDTSCRFDVVTVLFLEGPPIINHYKDSFY